MLSFVKDIESFEILGLYTVACWLNCVLQLAGGVVVASDLDAVRTKFARI
jgi:hypothetical protein